MKNNYVKLIKSVSYERRSRKSLGKMQMVEMWKEVRDETCKTKHYIFGWWDPHEGNSVRPSLWWAILLLLGKQRVILFSKPPRFVGADRHGDLRERSRKREFLPQAERFVRAISLSNVTDISIYQDTPLFWFLYSLS